MCLEVDITGTCSASERLAEGNSSSTNAKVFAVLARRCEYTAVRRGKTVACRGTSESQCRGGEDGCTRRRDRGIEGHYSMRDVRPGF